MIYHWPSIPLQADNIDFARLWSPKLYIENSLGDPKEQIRHRIIYNEKGEAFIYEKRVAKGTFMENLELDDFPFDVQVNKTGDPFSTSLRTYDQIMVTQFVYLHV